MRRVNPRAYLTWHVIEKLGATQGTYNKSAPYEQKLLHGRYCPFRGLANNRSLNDAFAAGTTRASRIHGPVDDVIRRQVGAAPGAKHPVAEEKERRRCQGEDESSIA